MEKRMGDVVNTVAFSTGIFVTVMILYYLRGNELSTALGRAILGVLAFFGGWLVWWGINTVKSKLRPK